MKTKTCTKRSSRGSQRSCRSDKQRRQAAEGEVVVIKGKLRKWQRGGGEETQHMQLLRLRPIQCVLKPPPASSWRMWGWQEVIKTFAEIPFCKMLIIFLVTDFISWFAGNGGNDCASAHTTWRHYYSPIPRREGVSSWVGEVSLSLLATVVRGVLCPHIFGLGK